MPLSHADKHDFLAIPPEDESALLDASRFMNDNGCETVTAAARSCDGLSAAEMAAKINEASAAFGKASRDRFRREGEF